MPLSYFTNRHRREVREDIWWLELALMLGWNIIPHPQDERLKKLLFPSIPMHFRYHEGDGCVTTLSFSNVHHCWLASSVMNDGDYTRIRFHSTLEIALRTEMKLRGKEFLYDYGKSKPNDQHSSAAA